MTTSMRTLWAVVVATGNGELEDFTEFEQRAVYFDGDPVSATKKGVNILERGSQVHFMGEFRALLDFPPAPKLGIDGKLDPARATPAEMRGQELFFGKAQCSSRHPAFVPFCGHFFSPPHNLQQFFANHFNTTVQLQYS